MSIVVVTTFPDNMWDVYAKKMVESFVENWPEEIPLFIQLDSPLLAGEVEECLREQDGVTYTHSQEHYDFVKRNKDKDHPTDYRKQAVRFCHKVFAIKRALDANNAERKANGNPARYLIWMDADVITTSKVTLEDIRECLPKEGDAVSYLGRKDWDHSECGWLAFDLDNGGNEIIEAAYDCYKTDMVFTMQQWHDSWVWDQVFYGKSKPTTNLTEDKPGTEIWQHSPMSKWSFHHKGPAAKQKLVPKQQSGKINIITKNSIPNEQIQTHISKNQELIKHWIKPCKQSDDEIIVVSAGEMMFPEDLRVHEGKRIVAVKHALEPLKKAGIKPWACILLDPRPHVLDFVKDADPDILWFVASQVNPEITQQLLERGCKVWGYHASVNAGEEHLINKQMESIVAGGSATATRGLHVLSHLGYKKFQLYGYDLCLPDKPDFDAKDQYGQPKYIEISLGMSNHLLNLKRCFWTEPQLLAQYEEIQRLIDEDKFEMEAHGMGIVPFILKLHRVVKLRRDEIKAKIMGDNPPTTDELLYG